MVAAQRDIFLTYSICAFLYKTTADNINKMLKWKIMIAVMLLLIRPSGTCAHIIAAFDHHWSLVAVSYVRLPEPRSRLFARIPPTKKSEDALSRNPLPSGFQKSICTNPQIQSNMFAWFCFGEYAADPKSRHLLDASNRQTHRSTFTR